MTICHFERSEKSSHQETEQISPVGRNDMLNKKNHLTQQLNTG
jgi:hypothetical protein